MIRTTRGSFLLRLGPGWDNSLGSCRPTSPGLHVFFACRCSRVEVLRTYTHTLSYASRVDVCAQLTDRTWQRLAGSP